VVTERWLDHQHRHMVLLLCMDLSEMDVHFTSCLLSCLVKLLKNRKNVGGPIRVSSYDDIYSGVFFCAG